MVLTSTSVPLLPQLPSTVGVPSPKTTLSGNVASVSSGTRDGRLKNDTVGWTPMVSVHRARHVASLPVGGGDREAVGAERAGVGHVPEQPSSGVAVPFCGGTGDLHGDGVAVGIARRADVRERRGGRDHRPIRRDGRRIG